MGEGGVRPVARSEGTIAAVRRAGAAPVVAPRGAATSKTAVKSAMHAEKALAPNTELNAKVTGLMEELTELKLKVETAEKERDFYFDKLRDIEILCQAPELAHMPVRKF